MIDAIKAIDGWETKTASELAALLQATGVTHRPVNRAELVHLLNMRGMLRKIVGNVTDEKWEGTVLAMQDVILQVGSDVQKNGIRLWFSHITNVSNNIWDTTQVAFAAPFWQMVQTFADQPTMPTMADFEAVAALGGGWKFASVTAEQVQTALDAESERVRLAAVDTAVAVVTNEIVEPAKAAADRTKASIAAALRFAADELEA